MSIRSLVLGHTGQIGWELMRSLQPLGRVKGLGRELLDISRHDEVVRHLQELRPDVVVNAAALTAVDQLEQQPDAARAVNGTAVGVIAEECRKLGCMFIHFSSDYVFDGMQTSPYREDAATQPLNVYGQSKLLGEQLIAQSGCRHLVLRIGGIYSLRRKNFLLAIVARARQQREVRVVSDQIAVPTPAWLVADVTSLMLQRWRIDPRVQDFDGVVNVGCTGRTSWHGFALRILDRLVSDPPRRADLRIGHRVDVVPISAAEFGAPAPRPAQVCLDIERLRNDWQIFPPSWETALALTLRQA